jgi:hypothetical protein
MSVSTCISVTLSETKRVVRFAPRGRRYEELVDTLKKAAFN